MSGRKSYDELKFDLYYANEQIKEMRKELINNDEYIGKLRKEYDKEIERLNKEIETLKQPQVFIDTQDMEERYAQGIYEDFIEEEYEKLIFDYLSNNCKEFDDEHIKKLVDLKVKQHLSSQKEIERLNNIIDKANDRVYDLLNEYDMEVWEAISYIPLADYWQKMIKEINKKYKNDLKDDILEKDLLKQYLFSEIDDYEI